MDILSSMLRIFQPGPDFRVVLEVDHDRSYGSEWDSVREGIKHRNVNRKEVPVFAFNKVQVLIHPARDVIWAAFIVECAWWKEWETSLLVNESYVPIRCEPTRHYTRRWRNIKSVIGRSIRAPQPRQHYICCIMALWVDARRSWSVSSQAWLAVAPSQSSSE